MPLFWNCGCPDCRFILCNLCLYCISCLLVYLNGFCISCTPFLGILFFLEMLRQTQKCRNLRNWLGRCGVPWIRHEQKDGWNPQLAVPKGQQFCYWYESQPVGCERSENYRGRVGEGVCCKMTKTMQPYMW